MTEANWRFGQPSAQGPKSAVFPFSDATQVDPVSGQTDGLLRRALQRGLTPVAVGLVFAGALAVLQAARVDALQIFTTVVTAGLLISTRVGVYAIMAVAALVFALLQLL